MLRMAELGRNKKANEPLGFLSTHPFTQDRVERARSRAQRTLENVHVIASETSNLSIPSFTWTARLDRDQKPIALSFLGELRTFTPKQQALRLQNG